jgi:integrase
MASITKVANGYRAQIFVRGQRESKVFRTKREADAWSAARETELRVQQNQSPGARFTLRQAFVRYRDEVTPTKRSARWEEIRIEVFLRDPFLPLDKPMKDITPAMFRPWRDVRNKKVSNGTVLREFGTLSAVFECARREWQWIDRNPVRDVRKPPEPPGRDVIISRHEIKLMLRSLNYSPRRRVNSITQSVAVCFLLALRTGMRAGELCGLRWRNIHNGYCKLPVTKTVPRDVPLTDKAMRVINKMREWDEEVVFSLSTQTLDALFRKYRVKASLSGFTFHDSRHTAATWIAGRMKSAGIPAQQAVFDLCKMFGWKRIDQALRYYNPTAAEIARRIR